MDAILRTVPERLETQRLILVTPRAGDGAEINATVLESVAEVARWMPWANPTPDVAATETWVRNAEAKFLIRDELNFMIRLKDGGTYLGNVGFHSINWKVPRLEIGYWLRTSHVGKGYMAEAVNAMTAMAFEQLGAARVEIRMDDKNVRSWAVAERCGFQLDAVLRNETRGTDGGLRDTRIYSKVRG